MKVFFKIIFSILLFAILLIAITPSILSTNFGKDRLLWVVHRFIPGKLEIRELQLSWLNPTKIQGIRLTTPLQQEVLKIDEISLDSLLHLYRFQQATIFGLNVYNAAFEKTCDFSLFVYQKL